MFFSPHPHFLQNGKHFQEAQKTEDHHEDGEGAFQAKGVAAEHESQVKVVEF